MNTLKEGLLRAMTGGNHKEFGVSDSSQIGLALRKVGVNVVQDQKDVEIRGNPLVRAPFTRNAHWYKKSDRVLEQSKLKVTSRDYFNKQK